MSADWAYDMLRDLWWHPEADFVIENRHMPGELRSDTHAPLRDNLRNML